MTNNSKGNPNPPTPGAGAGAASPAVSVPRLFRRLDWVTFLITFGAVWIGYFLTLAPELTLEDSGELATGSFYAGIPHPPGYPVWTLYTWLWTVLVPIKNVAWRVAMGEATGGALAAGLLGLLVSRGSSLLIEGIEALQDIKGRWENAICLVSGFVSGMLIGYNGFMWSQSVIVEVYSFGVASLMVVLLCLLRWVYAPHQRRYLYYALFFHGICFTNHQTLIVAAIGIEVLIAAGSYRMGRYLFLGNSIIYLCGLLLNQQHVIAVLDANQAVFRIFNVVGIGSLAAYGWFVFLSEETFPELCLDAALAVLFVSLAAIPSVGLLFGVLAVAALAAVIKFARDTRRLGWEWLVIIVCGVCWIAGASFYFYMPISGMTNPPMQWGYPRTVEGFVHAFTRGQYEKTNPTDIINHPLVFAAQLQNFGLGIVEEFNWVYAFLGLVPFLFFFKLHRRERAWIIGLTAIYLCLGVLLLILLNPPPDRAAQSLVRVFFTASHTIIALMVGYGLTLVAAYMATHYRQFRAWGLLGGAVATALAILSFTQLTQETFFGQTASVSLAELLAFTGRTFTNPAQYGLPVYAGLILIGLALLFVLALVFYRQRAPLAITLGIFALMPLHPILTHWSDNEQRNHWFGYWFGHDMFSPPFKDQQGKPLYPEMARHAVLYGGTDPGRFCPTYMIFCDSFIPEKCQPEFDPKFDRRDVYIITQNALADGTYLNYIRAHYNRSTQFDPPFFQELARSEKERQANYTTNLLARALQPLDGFFEDHGDRVEARRRTFTSWFTEEHFSDLPGFAAKLKPGAQQDPLSRYLYENLKPETQKLLLVGADTRTLRRRLAADLNALIGRDLEVKRDYAEKFQQLADLKGAAGANPQKIQQLEKEIAEIEKYQPFYSAKRFQHVQLSEYLQDFIRENPQSHSRVRLNRLLLEEAYPKEIARTKGGVYPDREIYIATPEDSARCFQDYLADAQRRLQSKQLKPGEDVHEVGGKVQVSGQVAVMAINGLLTKVMFDHNPKNEFYVEESFPLEWMYPHLTPFGIIMKINREPLGELSEEIVRRDHEFWSQYSSRLIGNWITYDTPVKDIAAFVEKVYLRRDYTGFTGDRKFIRDDQAQKAFSKLRSSIGGLYNWRVGNAKVGSPDQQRMIREADFTFRQAFAFCPYSPEAVFRYVQLLATLQRFDDALLIVETCRKLDPYNAQVTDLASRLRTWQTQPGKTGSVQQGFQELEQALEKNPNDFQAAFNLAGLYLQLSQNNKASEVLKSILENPRAEANALRTLLQAYGSYGNNDGIQATVAKLAARHAAEPENIELAAALADGYHAQQKDDQAIALLNPFLDSPKLDANGIVRLAQMYASLQNYPKLETCLEKLVKLTPDSPEAWYDLAALKIGFNKQSEALEALRRALSLNAERLKRDPKAKDLTAQIRNDSRFAPVREAPEFKPLLEAK